MTRPKYLFSHVLGMGEVVRFCASEGFGGREGCVVVLAIGMSRKGIFESISRCGRSAARGRK